MRSQIHSLQLVYPPISNQEAEWVKNDIDVQKLIQRSNLYFIGQKPESYYTFKDNVTKKVQEEYILPFKYHVGNKSTSGYLDLLKMFEYHEITKIQIEDIEIELGPKLIRFRFLHNDKVIEWFTTEKFIFDKSRKLSFIKGFSDYKDFSIYQLHYIGISKSDDSLKRLILKPHDKRLRILSNEHPLSNGSRVTDELILFFFEIDSIEFKQHLTDADITEFGTNELEDRIRIITDAEKAFVKIMNTQYNEVKFKSYPVSKDGLYLSTVDFYTFSIDEEISFMTPDNTIRGSRNSFFKNDGFDVIAINKSEQNVELIKL